jgi:hypothetical protein
VPACALLYLGNASARGPPLLAIKAAFSLGASVVEIDVLAQILG